jgi:hypothetical protein
VEVQFLDLVRAIEVYDRLVNGSSVLPKAEHRALVKRLVEVAPHGDQPWLKDKLAYSNEPTLRARVSRLLQATSAIMEPIVGDLDAFAKLVGDSRNYYTHYDASLRRKAATGDLLVRTNQRLSVLVAALLLASADVNVDALQKLFASSRNYIWLARIAAGHPH